GANAVINLGKSSCDTTYKFNGDDILSNFKPSLVSILGSSTSPKSIVKLHEDCINMSKLSKSYWYLSVYLFVWVSIISSLFFSSNNLLLYSVLVICFLYTVRFLKLLIVSP